MRTTLSLLGLFAISFPLASTGCLIESECTTEARSSVTVQVVDSMGLPIVDADVKYSVGGGFENPCDSASNDGTYVCGYEQEGDFTITATKGTVMATENVKVSADECHVISRSVKVTLGT